MDWTLHAAQTHWAQMNPPLYPPDKIDGRHGPMSEAARMAWWAMVEGPVQADPARWVADLPQDASFGAVLATIARSQLGVREVGCNNCGPQIREYQEATWLAPGAWPWCAAFVAWCVREAIDAVGGVVRFNRPRTAGAWDLENWATDRRQSDGAPQRRSGGSDAGVTMIKPLSTQAVMPGDIVVFTFSHVGIALGQAGAQHVLTVEGNTNAAGSREGDGVYERRRARTSVRSIIRMTV